MRVGFRSSSGSSDAASLPPLLLCIQLLIIGSLISVSKVTTSDKYCDAISLRVTYQMLFGCYQLLSVVLMRKLCYP